VRKQHRQHADEAEDEVDEDGEVVGADDPHRLEVAVPQEHRRERGAEEADEAEHGDVHALARVAEGLGQHGRQPRERDDDDRDESCVVGHGKSLLAPRPRGARRQWQMPMPNAK
jgi:hypothetical protein